MDSSFEYRIKNAIPVYRPTSELRPVLILLENQSVIDRNIGLQAAGMDAPEAGGGVEATHYFQTYKTADSG